ncbi:NAD-dependent epimerase/dehydratase family protein [Lewinella sp. IMCC34191]|uniref:NAD-dependent epimerase/dehydratase family protein n=1 Tax=Lewinella sp. IMCC34191 TaxID=2259172 RepID=UPI000E2650C0|nr:NAD-dependent epimerase/dehydratase family protein [Lewinella sp. IMCC34191]
MKSNLAVLGTGWLGMAAAHHLSPDYSVRGSYRRTGSRDELVACGVSPYYIDLPTQTEALADFLRDLAYLIVAIPPGGRTHGADTVAHYLHLLAPLRPYLPGLHLIYTSSTGVYGKSTTGTITESSPVAPDTHSSRAVVAAETFFREHAGRYSILRLGGLYGPDRDPIRFFRRVPVIPDGDAPVNMVSRQAVLEALRVTIKTEATGIFNVCSANHPPKRDFYGNLYAAANLPAKEFLPGGADGKRIDSSKFRQLGWLSP